MSIIDLHCDTITELKRQKKELRHNDMNLDLERMKKLGIMCQDFAIFIRMSEYKTIDDAWNYTNDCIKFFKDEIKKNDDLIEQIKSYKELMAVSEKKKMGALLSIEEGGIIGTDIERVNKLYDEGVRLITLSWNFESDLSYPNSLDDSVRNSGLKPFGKTVVEKMGELGMLVDVSHLSDGGFWDVADICKGPFVASHSDARSLANHPRNLTDAMIKRLAKEGGVTGINFFSKFLGSDGSGSIEQMVNHIKHIKNIGGIDVVALGSDFDGFGGASGVRTCEDFPKLFNALEKAGFTGDELEKITYKNALRVIKDVLA